MHCTDQVEASTKAWPDLEKPRSLDEYARRGLITWPLVGKLAKLGWTTDYQVINCPSVFGVLNDRDREALRSALDIEERRLKLVGNRLGW